VFDQWRHLDTLKSEIELHELDQSKQSLAFDLDTYHLLAKHLSKGSAHIISL
jgi:DNA polymerase-3 subunit epsilon